ncbi:zinc-dependent alcohol dehydrogenase family protein [Pseudomonas sp. LS44]|uniref:zinc-dependent alcohol dehydrogenase family protein n=1 Tax=Pseudomonas sp. LS44 TaxID=1357074 RepID=UPI00215B0BCD|nr:zinc-dependent alcohol dehydrogenase family protein [Pseudomonas sp. LS44]UVE18913.1 zinc-dependent alcohol dehydrogenase family protein [Pseudomonas sp. LS44]
MQAIIYQAVGQIGLEQRPQPQLQDATDAIVRVVKTTICGTDLHILKGDVPTCEPGRILGHEGVGIVEQVGSGVSSFKPGDRVLISCITACGRCDYCKKGMYSHCADGGWILGHRIDGTQAEYVRIPHADGSLHPLPAGIPDEAMVMLSDILPTGYECGVLNGHVQPGDIVAIIGAGPVGLAALLTAQFYAPAAIVMVDLDDNRLAVARQFGASHVFNSNRDDVLAELQALSNRRGADVAIEAVGVPATFSLCEQIIAPGGHIAVLGVHGVKVDLHLETLWSHNITLKTGLVDTFTTPQLLKMVEAGKLDPQQMITHRFAFSDALKAYEVFGKAADSQALKVILQM